MKTGTSGDFMNANKIKNCIEEIKENADDCEKSHSLEDDLMDGFITALANGSLEGNPQRIDISL